MGNNAEPKALNYFMRVNVDQQDIAKFIIIQIIK